MEIHGKEFSLQEKNHLSFISSDQKQGVPTSFRKNPKALKSQSFAKLNFCHKKLSMYEKVNIREFFVFHDI